MLNRSSIVQWHIVYSSEKAKKKCKGMGFDIFSRKWKKKKKKIAEADSNLSAKLNNQANQLQFPNQGV